MHEITGHGNATFGAPVAEDLREQSVVLHHLLWLHPQPLTTEELLREFTGDCKQFEQRDDVRRAVRDLVGAGLLHRFDDLLLPTRAAVRFYKLANA